MDFELDGETVMAILLGVVNFFIILVMMKFSGASFAWRIIAAVLGIPLGFVVAKFILSR